MDDFEKIKNKISRHIETIAEDNFINHFLLSFKFFDNRYYGNTSENGFKIWRRNRWTGIFYPVIFCEKSDENKIILKNKMNIFSKIIYFALTFVLIAMIFFRLIDNTEGFYENFGLRLTIGLFAIIGWFTLTYLAYKNNKDMEIESIIKLIKGRK